MSQPTRPLINPDHDLKDNSTLSKLLDQYKLYVESAQHVSELRATANNYLLTVNTVLVSLNGYLAAKYNDSISYLALPVAGILVCLVWKSLIESYRNLNTAKFAVIHQLESFLPAALFTHEWQLATQTASSRYRPLTHIEPYIPAVFAVLYAALATISFVTSH